VDDLVERLWRLFASNLTGPVNLGNPEEITVLELAERVRAAAGSDVDIRFVDQPVDDPQVRRPDISLARLELGWEPKVPLETGLERMVVWARAVRRRPR
jgi:nucleoside-diphosphate-sugar epimerase